MSGAGTVRFVAGVLGGWLLVAAVAVPLLLLVPETEMVQLGNRAGALLSGAWLFIQRNLQGSLLPFVLVLAVYFSQLLRMKALLAEDEPDPGRVVRAEQSLDLCASLFFGIGVIWTAIGMRDALLFALGDRDMVGAHHAFAVLQRLVDGGILLALSTTIVGGIGGYLMRAVKSVYLGRQLTELYMAESARPERESLAALQRIERRLGGEDSEE